MSISFLRNSAVAALSVAMAAPLAAQQAPRTLPAPDATYSEPFSQVGVGAVRELRDGRVIVADPRDKVLQAINFSTGTSTVIGREGSGPQEFGMPMRVLMAPGDTTFLFDPLNQRYLIIGPDAKPINTFRTEQDPVGGAPGGARDAAPGGRALPAPGNAPAGASGGAPPAGGARPGAQGGGPQRAGGGPVFFGAGLFPRITDAQGRIYATGQAFSIGPDGRPTSADSAPLVRFDRATRKLDTLAYVGLQKSNTQVTSGGAGNVSFRVGGANPLFPSDEWSVFPDGRIAIVRHADYHVDFVSPNGNVVRGQPIRYTPVRMNAAEIRAEEELRNRNRANQMSIAMTQDGNRAPQRTAQMGPPPGAPPLEPLTDWPDVKPPFRTGQASVLARPNGELWVRRTEAHTVKGTLYDVINNAGAVTHQVRIPDGWTLVGFGNGTIYTTKLDEDDLVYLQRHRM